MLFDRDITGIRKTAANYRRTGKGDGVKCYPLPVKKGAGMTDNELEQIEQEALEAYCKQELKSLKLSDEEIQELEENGDLIRFYAGFLNYHYACPAGKK